MKKSFVFIIRFLISISIIILLIEKIGLKKIIQTFTSYNIWIIPIVIILYYLSFIISAVNIKILLNKINIKIKFVQLFKYSLISWSLGLFVPGKIGEFSIIYFLNKHDVSLGEGFSISILDKFITITSLCLITIIGLPLFFNISKSIRIIALLILPIILFIFLGTNHKIRSLIRKYILRKHAKKFKGFSKTLNYFLKEGKSALLKNFILTNIKWILTSIIVYITFLSLGLHIPILFVLWVSCATTILSLIPISISGLGVRESMAIFLYGLIKINADKVLATYLILLIINYFLAALNNITLLDKRTLNYNNLKDE